MNIRSFPKHSLALARLALQAALLAGVALLSATSCASGGSQTGQAPPSGPPGAQPGGGCGMFLFTQPPCEAAFDQGCCAQQQNCANDPACSAIIRCWNDCESRRATEGCNCFNNCAPQGTNTPGIQLFGYVVDCTKGIQYPQNVDCSTGC